MRPHRLFAALAVASLPLPAASVAQFGEVWHSTPAGQYHLYGIGDLDANGSKDFLTGESESSQGEFIAVRLAATGALQAQTSVRYQHLNLFHYDIDGDGPQEILFLDNMTGRQNCITFSGPPGPLVPRWAIRPLGGAPFNMFFADLDGNGRLYVVFQQTTSSQLEVYTRMGVLFGTYTPSPPPGSFVFDYLDVQDFDGDGRDEILLVFRATGSGTGQYLVMLESSAPVSAQQGPDGLRAIELGSSIPNPATAKARIGYTVPMRGPVSLRLLDVQGREVRVLVDGEVTAGRHQAIWDGRDARGRAMPAGTYFYVLTVSGQHLARQLVRLE